MRETPDHNPIENDPMMDTQRLLGMEPPAEGEFDLEEILAEFGPRPAAPVQEREGPERAKEPEKPSEPEELEEPEPQDMPEPSEEAAEPPQAAPQEEIPEEKAPERRPPAEKAPEEEEDPFPAFAPPAARPAVPEDAGPAKEAKGAKEPRPPRPPSRRRAERKDPPPEEVTMEDIVANTVDAVKGDQARQQERLRKKLERARGKLSSRPAKKKEAPPLPAEDERTPAEEAGWHKRRLRECRKSLVLAVPVLLLMWLPWVLVQSGVAVPFFSDSADNAALCVLVPQTLISVICWPVFRSALGGLRHGAWNICTTALLSTAVTLLDEMTLLLLPERTDAAPLGGLAAALTVFALWGLKSWHRGMLETFRTAAMGEPSRVVDRCGENIAKGAGGRKGFCARANMEDTSSQWQRLLLPVLAAASLVFAILASVGQERRQDMLWCWSAILCAASPLAFPLAFSIPFGRLATRLARTGAALAGQYGAAALKSVRRLAVTDTDLFPQGCASLGGLNLYGEERNRAVSYAATLAVQGGGLLGRVFGDVCERERISYQGLEHFHIHDEGGLSGMIRGETVLLGPPVFMRHKAVRLPATLSSKPTVCLAVDGSLTAVFTMKYIASDTVDAALRLLRRNGMQITLAARDGNVTPRLLKAQFGGDCGASCPELSERLSLSDPEREAGGPNGLLYREGLLPFASLAAGSRRLCQTARVGNLLSIAGGVAGVLLGFYLTFTGSYNVLTPLLLLTYELLWAVPLLPLVWTVDQA